MALGLADAKLLLERAAFGRVAVRTVEGRRALVLWFDEDSGSGDAWFCDNRNCERYQYLYEVTGLLTIDPVCAGCGLPLVLCTESEGEGEAD